MDYEVYKQESLKISHELIILRKPLLYYFDANILDSIQDNASMFFKQVSFVVRNCSLSICKMYVKLFLNKGFIDHYSFLKKFLLYC